MNLCDFKLKCRWCMGEETVTVFGTEMACPACRDAAGNPRPPAPEGLRRVRNTFLEPHRYIIKEDYYDEPASEDRPR